VAEDVLRTARDAFLLGASGGKARIESSPEQGAQLQTVGASLGNATLVRVLETVGKAIVDMRGTDAADPRLVLEIALVRLTKRDADSSVAALADRVDTLERTIAELRAGGGGGAASTAPTPRRPAATSAPAPKAAPAAPAPAAEPAPAPAPGATLGALRKQRQQAQQAQQAKAPAGEAATGRESERRELAEEGTPAAGAASAALPTGAAGARAREGDQGKGSPAAASDDQRASVSLDDVILTWSEILPSLPVATRSAVQQAQPIELKDDVITFAVPRGLIEAARPRFKREADTIRVALTERLGRKLKFQVIAGEFDAVEQAPAAEVSPAAASETEDADDLDPGELTDAAPDDVAVASFGLLTESLGASVVEERPRE
jgi:DNA polymerase-3 subunit gamma/tau